VGKNKEVLLMSREREREREREGDWRNGGNSRTGEERSETTEFLANCCCISCVK